MSQEKENYKTERPAFGPRGMGGGLVEKPKSFKETMVKLIRYCKNYLPVIIIAFVAAIGGTLLQIIGPDKLKDLTNEIAKGLPAIVNQNPVLGSIDFSSVAMIAWTLVFMYAGSTLLNLVQSYLMAGATQKISRQMRTDISQKINRLPLRYFDRASQGDVLSRVTNDVDTIGQTLNQSLGTLISSVTMLAGSLVMMFINNWILALTAVGCSLLGFVLMIVMVLQDTWIFDGTIRENIVYCKPNVTDEQVKQVCRTVGLHHFIKTLPKGYDTVLDDSVGLSEGQKQLITIARAMIQNAPLLILDEATSSVDTRTERIVQRAMDQLTQGRTSFVIAHRLSTIKNADLILVMKDGDIIESGTHAQLLEQSGFYAELYNSQFEPAA